MLFSCFVQAQNLIPNGDFETRVGDECPSGVGQIKILEEWKSPSKGTPDLICGCNAANKNVSTKRNFAGHQEAHSGTCYAGLIAGEVNSGRVSEYSEYIMVKLPKKLVKNNVYRLEFYYSLGDYSLYKAYTLGAMFVNSGTVVYSNASMNKGSVSDSLVNNDDAWNLFSAEYTATGLETHLVLGSFQSGFEPHRGEAQPEDLWEYTATYAYYYIDDVSLTATDKIAIEKPVEKPFTWDDAVNKTIVLKNVYFETDKSNLLPASFTELDKLCAFLKKNTEYSITLSGHTDNVGTEEHNLTLSTDRAKSVGAYLVLRGIPDTRIATQGYGSSRPIAANDTDANRQLNRRVEIMIE
jgi:outer membrane protein OmpA-like peptidoglycan-associated protein